MSRDDQDNLIKRLRNNSLSSQDKEAIVGLFEFNNWLQTSVQEKNISINRLQKIFGSRSEKRSKKKKKDKDDAKKNANVENEKPVSNDDLEVEATETDSETEATTNNQMASKNSGHLSASDYTDVEVIPLSTPYKPGDPCPEGCGGKLKIVKPGSVIKITGQSFAKATKYELEKLRCNLCEQYFSAELPATVTKNKYDSRFKAYLCVYKHYLGVPSYRLAGYQEYVGVPLPDSTQWDKIEEVANDVYPAFNYLEHYAANAYLTCGDDTRLKILSVMKLNSTLEIKSRQGMFTTGVVAYHNGHKIHLFLNGVKHAGENMKSLLSKRDPRLPKVIHMCDALSANMPKDLKAVVLNCLVHARRNFVEIEKYFPKECTYILEQFSAIYKNESEAKSLNLTGEKRLSYHREKSRPHVKLLYQYIISAIRENRTEENSSLGKAYKYMIRHAKRLTRFLRILDAPLDNNVTEQSLKMAIRVRKNSLFYATEHGAYVGGR